MPQKFVIMHRRFVSDIFFFFFGENRKKWIKNDYCLIFKVFFPLIYSDLDEFITKYVIYNVWTKIPLFISAHSKLLLYFHLTNVHDMHALNEPLIDI